MSNPITTRRVVITSLMVDLFDIASNLVVTLITNSAVVFAEMAQGIADATGSLLIVVGFWRAGRPRSPEHPRGHGREVFFWFLLAALSMLVLGAGLSFWRGHAQLVDPTALEHVGLAFAILGVSICTNGYAFGLSLRNLGREGVPLVQAFRASRRPLVNATLVQDGLGTLSSVLGLVALLVCVLADVAILDGVGALLVAVLMVFSSLTLMNQARHLIAGRGVPRRTRTRILRAVEAIPQVKAVNGLTAVFTGAQQIEVDVDLYLRDHLTTPEIEVVIDRVQSTARTVVSDVTLVRIDLNSP